MHVSGAILDISYDTLKSLLQAWHCLQRNPHNVSTKHEPEKSICKYNI
jgi:hypothetical protein